MSVEKCFAVYFPLKSKTISTIRKAKLVTGAAGVVLAAFNTIIFFWNLASANPQINIFATTVLIPM